jgi:hypothetical protein
MPRPPAQPTRTQTRTTVGRLGGLSSKEADRGERALWLAGEGYRAALFHLGALTRLNEFGLLAQLGTVGAVSGGSIIAALLATRIPWPIHGAYRDWPERVAEPMRTIAQRNARARAILRKPFPGAAAEAALEERYARELVVSLGGESRGGPHFVFGASGLTLSGLAAGWEECLEWGIEDAEESGYPASLVTGTIAGVRTDLDAFGEAEQAVLENHGYLLADAAARRLGATSAAGIQVRAPAPPHPHWMGEDRVREALAASGRRVPVGRLRPRRVRGSSRRPESASERKAALLERHRPVLQYDSLESCRADSVAMICSHALPGRCNTLHRPGGSLIAAAAPASGEPKLSLDFLRGPIYPNGELAGAGDYLDECGGTHASDAMALRDREGYADLAYGRARHDQGGTLWLQYWFFFYYYDRGLLGIEQREGDWQMVQLRLDSAGVPDAATLTRPTGAQRLGWEELEKQASEAGPVAVIYPARGSHTLLPRAGSHEAPIVPDHNDGLGPRLRPQLEMISDDGPGWVLWPGRWGSTRRREHFEVDSPRGPREHPQWWDPAALHAEAAPGPELTSGAGPGAPSLQARRDGNLAVVSYRFEERGAGAGEPARIVAVAVGTDGEPSHGHPIAVEDHHGEFALQLGGDREWNGVRVAATSEQGVSGETVGVTFA